ncbi:XRE family transcriptional regulator [Paenibacillus polymyxa]|uniref:XRE family transcriptional regulator n=1 Tax=Paenibacillus polymyxa TaxID=1406 RepID=UPI002ED3F7C3|nr:XRE family transcriptional regulator [Paenibacillus polymyxa]
MLYAKLLKNGVALKGLSLNQICFQLAKRDIWLDRAVLSKMKNGKLPPAKDHINIALAEILGIDSNELRLAAARETIDPKLYELIRCAG